MPIIPAEITDLSELDFIVGSKPACVQCRATYRTFDKNGIAYETKDMSTAENVELLELARELNYMEAPIVFVYRDGVLVDHWSGFRPDKHEVYAALSSGPQEVAA